MSFEIKVSIVIIIAVVLIIEGFIYSVTKH